MNRYLPLALLAVPIAGCEPLRGVVSDKEIQEPIDLECVQQALEDEFGAVELWDYISAGDGYTSGSEVAQFAYYHSDDRAGWATLRFGPSGDRTRIEHEFTGIGTRLPQEVFPPALEAMQRAREVLRSACGIDLSGMELSEVGQDVDALN